MINFTQPKLNGFYNLDDSYMSDLLHEMRNESYEFQRAIQLDSVVMERVDFKLKSLKKKLMVNGKNTVAVYRYTAWNNYPFVNPIKHVALKRSGLMWSEVGVYDISKRTDIFDKNFMAFIDGSLVDYINIVVRPDGIEFVCDIDENEKAGHGLKPIEYKELIARDVTVNIIFFSNSDFNPLNTNFLTVKKQSDFMYNKDTAFMESLRDNESYLSFIRNSIGGITVKLSHSLNRASLMDVFGEYNRENQTQKGFINVYGFRNLSGIIRVGKTEKVIQLDSYDMPIPTDNILIFTVDRYGVYSYNPTVTLTHHFPNFYTVDNPTDLDLDLLIFYSEDNSRTNKYYNAIENYYKYMTDSVAAFLTSPSEVKNFTPIDVDFSIKEFDTSDIDDPLVYKIKKLDELVQQDPEYLRTFLRNQFTNGDGYYIDISKIDLVSRLREDNSFEVKSTLVETFDKPHYVITLKNPTKDGLYEFNMLIDGLLFIPKYMYEFGFYTFVYVPTDLLTSRTVVEIERNRVHNVMDIDFNFATEASALTLMISPNTLSKAEFSFIDDTTNESFKLKDFDFFCDGGVSYNADVHELIREPQIKIRCSNPSLLKRDIRINYGRGTYRFNHTMEIDSTGLSVDITGNGYIERHKIRAYKNGRSIPVHSSTPYNDTKLDTVPVSVITELKRGDNIVIEYNPNIRKVLLDLKSLPEDGIINLNGFIDKPFDLTWYDIYVNGRKLTKFNVDIITPFIIKLKNLRSSKNLTMYEIVRGKEIISLEPQSKTVIDDLWDSSEVFRNAVKLAGSNNIDIEDDTLSENIFWYTEQVKDLLGHLAGKNPGGVTHIQPDSKQITKAIEFEHQRVVDDGVTHINPDVRIPGVDNYLTYKIGAD